MTQNLLQICLACNCMYCSAEVFFYYEKKNNSSMDWINCNSCCRQPGDEKERTFCLTSCGHIFCDKCLSQGIKILKLIIFCNCNCWFILWSREKKNCYSRWLTLWLPVVIFSSIMGIQRGSVIWISVNMLGFINTTWHWMWHDVQVFWPFF